MLDKEKLNNRLQIRYKSLYELAKQYAKIRDRLDGEASPPTHYHSTISRAIENPGRSKLETIEGIVEALDGELRIIWEPEKTITLQLDNEQIAALQERAEYEGVTISKIAEQFLQLAFSGKLVQKPKRLTELVEAEETKIHRSMHPLIESAYSGVHQWLATRPEAQGYKELDYFKDLEQALGESDLKNAAFQYYSLFSGNFFKSVHVLDKVINSTRLPSVLKYNPRICILEVGSAMGAASVALIERIVNLKQSEAISESKNIEIFCLIIDPNFYRLVIYKELMQEIGKNLIHWNINLEFQYIPVLEGEGFSKAIINAISYLQKKREEWKQPILSNLQLMQLDIASFSPHQNTASRLKQKAQLKEMGLEIDDSTERVVDFWKEEALGYKQLLEAVPIENLYISTIETKNFINSLKATSAIDNFKDASQRINEQFNEVIGQSNHISIPLSGEQKVNFDNPLDSYWYEQGKIHHEHQFSANFNSITSKQIEDDKEWQVLTSLENLESAWVKARRNLLHIESCYDEIEIKLFESNLDNNIGKIQEKLMLCCEKIIDTKETLNYNFIKSSSESRLKQLSRLEEEIIACAIIQTLGKKTNLDFYSSRLQQESSNEANEYLYENYFNGYEDFLDKSRKSAEEYKDGAVLRTDIKSYYTMIARGQLIDITKRELNIISDRVDWLIKKIQSKDLAGHKSGIGISQGTITSGFYANLYLSPVDKKFKKNNKWKVKFYRYADDMIFVLPNITYIKEVESALRDELDKLKLQLNESKTEYYKTTIDFLHATEEDKLLEELSEKFNFIIYRLWLTNSEYRTKFEFANTSENENLWWFLISLYQQCLYSINIHIAKKDLSRKIYRYLFDQKQRTKPDLKLPPFPQKNNYSNISNWAKSFDKLEKNWLNEKNSLKIEIVKLFKQSFKQLLQVIEERKKNSSTISQQQQRQLNVKRRRLETRIRFAIPKLIILGLDEVWQEIVDLICSDLFLIRNNLLYVVISLASQGYTDAINQLKEYYQNNSKEKEASEYIRAVILEALRFLPSLTIEDWQLIFETATEGKSDIEKLKATETWLYLGDIAKQFVQAEHIQAVVTALNSEPKPFTRLKKNYILILGMHAPDEIYNIKNLEEQLDDYLIVDAVNLAQEEKVLELIKQDEPAIIRQYYSVKDTPDSDEKSRPSLNW